MRKIFIAIFALAAALAACAAEPWTVDRCIQYAMEHSHTVSQQRFSLEDSRAEKTRAIGAFLPEVYGSVSGQLNFGRAIDPSTNTYTNVSTLYNGYGLQAALTLFDGLQRYNQLRLAKANVAMGRSAVQAEKDDVALKVYKACMDLIYCEGAVDETSQKRDESRALLHQTEVMAEVGQKSDADVAQMRATLAADEYELAHMQSQTTKARLALKQLMNFPADSTLVVASPLMDESLGACSRREQDTAGILPTPADILAYASTYNPRVVKARHGVEAARYSLRAAHGALLPTISLSGGVSTSFYRNLDKGGHASFSEQFKNNAGQFVGMTLSIPIFNQLSTTSTIRRRKIALEQAQENLAYEQAELHRIVVEALADVENSRKEVAKMREQVAADSLASHLTTRKYEEGLASSIDVRTAAVTLLQSRVKLLQSQLTMAYNQKLLAYYEGKELWK